VLSCLMRLTADARMESFEIVEGVIRSAARMTYTEVHEILEGAGLRRRARSIARWCRKLSACGSWPAAEQAAHGARQHRFRSAGAGD
jgi:hypothetical protein